MLEQILRPSSAQPADFCDPLRAIPASTVSPLTSALRGVAAQRVFLLRGDLGSGRRDVVHAAAEQARRAGVAVTVLELDYEGWDDERPDGLPSFLDQLLDKKHPSLDESARERLRATAALVIKLPGKSAIKATLVSLALATDDPDQTLAGLLAARRSGRDQTPPDARDLLSRMLDELGQTGPTILHVADLETWPLGATRRWLFRRSRETDRPHPTVLTLACHSETSPAVLHPYGESDPGVIDVTPHDRSSLAHWLSQACDADRATALTDLLWERTGGLPRLIADSLHAISGNGSWRERPDGGWQLTDTHLIDTRSDRSALERRLGPPLAEEVERRIVGLPRLQANVRDFLRLGALCGELIPAEHVLGALGLVAERQTDVLDLIDEHLVETEVPLLVETDVQHRAFPSVSIYRFASPLIRRVMLDASDDRARDEQAQSLIAFLEPLLPKVHRAEARLLLTVSEHLATDAVANRYRTLLDIWAPWDEALQQGELGLQHELTAWLGNRGADPDVLWLIANRTRAQWPPPRRILILDCYRALREAAREAELPADRRGLFHFLRAEALVQSGRVPEAEADARQALALVTEQAGDDSPNLAAVLALLGAVLVNRSALSEARSVLERSLEIERAVHGMAPHPQVAFAQARLARVLELIGDLPGTRGLLTAALETLHRTLGEEHPIARTITSNLENLDSQPEAHTPEP